MALKVVRGSVWEFRAIAVLLALLFAATAFQAWWLSLTVDEPSHLLSSYLYWRGRDRLYPRDLPPLIKIAGGWPSRFMHMPVPEDLGRPGDTRLEWSEASQLIQRTAATKLQRFVFWSRLPLAVFPLVTVWVFWLWARDLFGAVPAFLVAAFWALCPGPLGHAALFKNDVAAACTYLVFWYAAWRYWKCPTVSAGIAVGCAAAFAALAKLSMLFLIPLAPLLILAKARDVRGAAVSLACCYVLLLAAYRFELHWTSARELEALARESLYPAWFVVSARVFQWIPVPEGLWTGLLSLIKSNAAAIPVYMLGRVYPEGNRLYFLLGTVLKMPFPALALAGASLVLLARRKLDAADAFWLAPGFLYFVLASWSSLHLGVRLVFPAWAFAYLMCGVSLQKLWSSRSGRPMIALACSIVFLLSARSYPNGLSFFNPVTGGAPGSLRFLADSNIDWGQALRDTAKYAERHGIRQLHLAYFGFDQPSRFFKGVELTAVAVPWSDQDAAADRLHPEPGWYAISASLLPGHFFPPQYRNYFAEFLRRHPVATPGGSIFVYRID